MLLVALLLSATAGLGQNRADDETALRDLLTTLSTNIKKQDAATLGTYYTDDYIMTTPDGRRMNKAERLADLKASKRFEQFEYNDVVMRFYGPATAIITSTVRTKRVGEPARNAYGTMTVVKTEGNWLVASGQGTYVNPAATQMASKP